MVAIRRGYVDTSVGEIHYREAGQGEPLLLLHQSATCSIVYEPVMQYLAPSYRTVAMDTPGFGMSDYPQDKFTVAQYAGIVLEFLDALKIPTVSLFGHHTGASIACEVAASAPTRVSRLILNGPPCVSPKEGQQRLRNVTPPDKRLDLENMHNELVWRLKAGPRYIETYAAVFTYDMARRLPLIQAPTLVMAAESDTLAQYVDKTAHLVKRSRQLMVPQATNFMMLQEPERLAGIIRNFLVSPGV